MTAPFLGQLIRMCNTLVRGASERELAASLSSTIAELPGARGFTLLPGKAEPRAEDIARCTHLLPGHEELSANPPVLEHLLEVARTVLETGVHAPAPRPMLGFRLQTEHGVVGVLVLLGCSSLTDEIRLLVDSTTSLLHGLEERRARRLSMRVEQEHRLRDALDRAERANREKTRLLAGLSHRVRTGMSSIVSFLDLVSSDGELSEEARGWCSLVRRDSDHLLGLIDQAVELSGDEASGTEPSRVRTIAEASRRTPPRIGPCRVLVVDDNLDNLLLLKHWLGDLGLEARMATSGAQCLEVLETEPDTYPLVLLDLKMPHWSGFETLARLRESHIHTPVVALTAHASLDDERRCLAAGFDGYLAKPIHLGNLAAVLSRHVPAYREDPAAPEELLSSREEEESFRPLLVGYLTRMRDSLTDLAEITRTRARREATVFAHKLRGTARSYGYPRIGAHAGALEELLRDPHTPDQDWLSSMTALAGLMRAATARLATLQGDPDGTAA